MREKKDELRRAMRERRLGLSAEAAARAAEAATAHLLGLPELRRARVVALYAAIRGELATLPLARALRGRGARLAYPRVPPTRHRLLDFHYVEDEAALAPSSLGIPEPSGETPRAAAEIDVFVVPGLAFDLDGERLGWGRGYYDHTLAAVPQALRVGFAFELQVVPRVPAGADDVRMDRIVTEARARATTAGQAPNRRAL